MRNFYTVFVILAAQLTIAAGLQARRENDAAPRANRHQRSSRSATHLITDDVYLTDAAGAYVTGSGAKLVTAMVTVPNITVPSLNPTAYALSFLVGLDGINSDSGLSVGVDIYFDGFTTTIDSWYEWYPDYSYQFDDLAIDVGDLVILTVTATSNTSGTALVQNLSTGVSASHAYSGELALEQVDAEWIIETDDTIDFTIVFQDAQATFSTGTVGPLDATIINSGDTVSLTATSVTVISNRIGTLD